LNACSDKKKYVIRFIVDTIGIARDFEFVPFYPMEYKSCLNAKDSIVRSEILRVLKMMPKWEPGYFMGKKINWWFSIQVNIPYTDFRCQNIHY
jgi:hypothetical protein